MKRSRLSRVSFKRMIEMREYSKKRKSFLSDRPICEKCNRRPSKDVHHKHGRLAGNYLNELTWAALCRTCHDEIHNAPGQARRTGWIV